MERLTERFDNGQAAVMGCGENCKYDYKYCRNHYEDCPEINRLYERLAEYEDTGLTPEQIMELKERNTPTECRSECDLYDWSCGACVGECDEYIKARAKEIIRKHMNDGWIPVDERLPTQEECEDNWFWIAYGNSFGNSPRIAKCEWVFADDEDGNDDSGPEFYIDQFPFPYKPSKNLIKAWKIIDIPSPYRPERNE